MPKEIALLPISNLNVLTSTQRKHMNHMNGERMVPPASLLSQRHLKVSKLQLALELLKYSPDVTLKNVTALN